MRLFVESLFGKRERIICNLIGVILREMNQHDELRDKGKVQEKLNEIPFMMNKFMSSCHSLERHFHDFLEIDHYVESKLSSKSLAKKYKYFTMLLNEDKTKCDGSEGSEGISQKIPRNEDMVSRIGKLLKAKIQAHSQQETHLLTASDIIKTTNPSLVSIMYRLATEDFVKNSTATFKIIECRNATKLVTDWKPSLVDIIMSLGHQVILVEMKEFPHYTDFAYSIIRQMSHCWKNRLPRSFFYPEDVCFVESSLDKQVIIVSPLLPDGEIDLTNQKMEDHLTYEILLMLKDSCASGLKNHLLKRDLRVGNFSDTEIGVNSIRHIYRSLQRRVNSTGAGENIQMGGHPRDQTDFHQFLLSLAGDSLSSAQSYIDYCKNPDSEPVEKIDKEEEEEGRSVKGTGDEDDDKQKKEFVHHRIDETGDAPVFPTTRQSQKKTIVDTDGENSDGDIFDRIIESLQEIQCSKGYDSPEETFD